MDRERVMATPHAPMSAARSQSTGGLASELWLDPKPDGFPAGGIELRFGRESRTAGSAIPGSRQLRPRGRLALGRVPKVAQAATERTAEIAEAPGTEDDQSDEQDENEMARFDKSHAPSIGPRRDSDVGVRELTRPHARRPLSRAAGSLTTFRSHQTTICSHGCVTG